MNSESHKPDSVLYEAKCSNSEIDNRNSKEEKSHTHEERQLVLSSQEPVQSGHTQITTTQPQQSAQPKYSIIQRFSEMPYEGKGVAVNTFMLFLTIILAVFAYGQCQAARDSVIIAQKSLDVANETLKDARVGAKAAEERAERMTKDNEDLAAAARLQAEGIGKSVEVGRNTARAAEKSANIAAQAMVVSSQAYVATTINFSNLTANKDMDMELVFTNEGNSPATISANYVVRVHFTPLPPSTNPT